MDSNYPTTKIKEEVKNNDEAEDTPGIKVEQKDPDYEADHESIRFEEVKMKVEGESSISTMEYMGIEDKKEACDIAPLTDEKEIKVETDEADYVTYDMLKKIKDEPNTDQWDELNPAMDAAEHVKKEEPAAVAVKVEGVDSTKTEEMDTTELTEEVDIKPDDDGGVDSAVNQKYWEKGLRVGHQEAEGELFICYNCNYTARTKRSLSIHIRWRKCKLNTNANELFTSHKRSYPSNKYVCTKCDKAYKNKRALDDHIIKIHPNYTNSVTCKVYGCSECAYKTTMKSKLESHIMLKHSSSVSTFKFSTCIHCNKSLKNKVTLDDHIIKKHPSYLTSVTRKVHKCSECIYKSTDKSMLKSHIVSKHPGAASRDKLGSICMFCDERLSNNTTLKAHIVKVHPDCLTSVAVKVHECAECTYKTTRKRRLDSHILSKHPGAAFSDNLGRTCMHCDARFGDNRTLNNHILRTHPNNLTSVTAKVHECAECAYKTVRKGNLDRHILAEHPDSFIGKIYQCSNCTYKTIKKANLDRHLLKHPDADKAR